MIAYAATATGVASDSVEKVAWLIDLITSKIPLWIAAFILILATFLLARIVRGIIESRIADKVGEEHQEAQILGGRISYIVIMTLGITIALKIAGIDLTTIIAAVAFGIGFALQDLIMNFIAGIMILMGKQFTIGDFIKVGGTMGKIVEIQTRNTVLKAIDGTKVIVPNADLFSNQVVSCTSNPFRRIEVETAIDYRIDMKNAMRVCMAAVKKTKGVLLEPKPAVIYTGFGDSNIDMKVRCWVNSRSSWLKIKSELIRNLMAEYNKYGITMAYNTVNMLNDKENPIEEKMMPVKKTPKLIATPMVGSPTIGTPVVTNQIPVGAVVMPTVQAQVVQAPVLATEAVPVEDDKPLKPLAEIKNL